MARGRAFLGNLLKEQGYKCFYCKSTVEDPTVDHVWPISSRKVVAWHVINSRMNKVAACRLCNTRKSRRQPTDLELKRLLHLKRISSGEADAGEWLLI